MRYNEAREQELVAEIAALDESITTVSAKCNDLYQSDENFDSAKARTYTKHMMRHRQLIEERGSCRAELAGLLATKPKNLTPGFNPRAEQHPMERFLRRGSNGLTAEEQTAITDAAGELGEFESGPAPAGGTYPIIDAFERNEPYFTGPEPMAAATRSDLATGGELLTVPEYRRTVIGRLKAYGAARRMSASVTRSAGVELNIPSIDATAQKGRRRGAQASARANAADLPDPTNVKFGSFTYDSDSIRITVEMVNDAMFPIMGWAEQHLVVRLGRIMAEDQTKGAGSSGAPVGFVTAARTGGAGASDDTRTASATQFTFAELLGLQERVDAGYLDSMLPAGVSGDVSGGVTGYQVSRPAYFDIVGLQDGDGRPLLLPDWRTAGDIMIWGESGAYPVVVNYDMDAVASAKVPIVFGNFSYHLIADVGGLMLFSFLDSRTIQNFGYELMGFMRSDCRPIGTLFPSTHAFVADRGKTEAFVGLKMKT